ncbi:MAG: hypothetical protein KJS45_01630 [Bacteroidetes bacterium]|nr:hypothetical protein [Bacteroidota bacterium]
MKFTALILLLLICYTASAQITDSTTLIPEEEENYDNLSFADGNAKRFCTSKIFDLSPQKLISIGYDFQGGYAINSDTIGTYAPTTVRTNYSQGLRLMANIPVISRNNIIVQLGANYLEQRYQIDNTATDNLLSTNLSRNGLRSTGLNTTIFKPLNERNFIIAQASADLNGDYGLNTIPSLRLLRYSGAAIFGWKTGDRRMFGVGFSRTYRVGEMNYIPIILWNWTSLNRKWGTEVLFPARAHVRRTINSRNMFFVGYELEGNSYKINSRNTLPSDFDNLEIRRSELRFRTMYEFSLYQFIWLSVQTGFRYNYGFNVDDVSGGNEFFRGFFGNQPYAMINTIGNTFYALVSINVVSP